MLLPIKIGPTQNIFGSFWNCFFLKQIQQTDLHSLQYFYLKFCFQLQTMFRNIISIWIAYRQYKKKKLYLIRKKNNKKQKKKKLYQPTYVPILKLTGRSTANKD